MGSSKKGFTLVELLVVIGIIALLISILMPALNNAREQARAVTCLSNMRQLGAAFMMYLNENKGHFPSPAGGTFDNPWVEPPAPRLTSQYDWIYWHPTRDMDQSMIAPMLGTKGEALKAILRCPSDVLEDRLRGYVEPYQFSYTMNFYFFAQQAYPQVYGTFGLRQTSRKILLAEEIYPNDGLWWPGIAPDDLGTRHHKKSSASFADGHGEWVEPAVNYDPNYTIPGQ